MRILHINSLYASGGKPAFYKNFFETLIAQGVGTEVYVPVHRGAKIVKEADFGCFSQVVRNHNRIDIYPFFPKQNKIIKDANERYAGDDFDVIHAHSLFNNGYVANKLSKRLKIPYIVAVRDTDINYFFRYMFFLKRIGYKILSEAGLVIFINEPYRCDLLERILPTKLSTDVKRKSITLPNGIDDFWHKNLCLKKRMIRNKALDLLTVGHLSKRKNQLVTVKAAELLRDKGFNVTLSIIGQVKDKSLFNKIKKYDFVNYIPPLPKEELLPYYRKADVFVLPSKTETFGLVYAEAMTQGLPVIYTRGQGFDGQFEEGTIGYSVKHDDPAEIADKIQKLLTNYELISENCRRLSQRYDWEKITREYITIYQDILQQKTTSS